MKLTEKQFELIEAYLNGELSETDRISFEDEVRQGPQLLNEIETQRQLRLGLRALAIEQQLQQARQRLLVRQNTNFKSDVSTQQRGQWRYWSAAASVIFVIGISAWLYQQDRNRDIFSETYSSLDDSFVTKDLPAELSAEERQTFGQAQQQFRRGRYAGMRQLLQALPPGGTSPAYRSYLIGLSYLADKKPTSAILPLKQAAATATGTLKQKTDWFLALAYLTAGDSAEAGPRLRIIAADKQHPYQKWAQRALKKL